jgi:hypothetical protein
LFGFCGQSQVSLISVGVRHEAFSVCEPYIGLVILLLQMIGFEISISNKAPHIQITENNEITIIKDESSTYGFASWSAFQSGGRLTPSCGHAAQKSPFVPFLVFHHSKCQTISYTSNFSIGEQHGRVWCIASVTLGDIQGKSFSAVCCSTDNDWTCIPDSHIGDHLGMRT